MATSSDPGHFFQTTSSLEERDRKSRKASNTSGNPIKLTSKLLAIVSGSSEGDGVVFVAEAAGTIKQLSVEDGVVEKTFRGPTAPVTCLCCGPDNSIFAGCWDKSIWHFREEQTDGASQSPVQYTGHTDFVKSVLYLRLADRSDLLISGGADGDLLFWSPAQGSKYLHRISPQSRSIECLVLDPYSSPQAPAVYLSTSQREIYSVTLPSSIGEIKSTVLSSPLVVHETSVYKLHFDNDGDLWTASADRTSKHLPRDPAATTNTFSGSDTTLLHPDFVRDVLTTHTGLAVTACRDENVRVWNAGGGELLHVFSGHFEEVTGLALVGPRSTMMVASVSIDGTVRRWDVSARGVQAAAAAGEENSGGDGTQGKGIEKNEFGLTEEEEEELRALMEDEEREGLERVARDEQ